MNLKWNFMDILMIFIIQKSFMNADLSFLRVV